jgi:hypothetical protein
MNPSIKVVLSCVKKPCHFYFSKKDKAFFLKLQGVMIRKLKKINGGQ